ncbi:MAG: TRAP transporter small permease subunit [Rhodobacteraceae bacterium]|nr:MAG: TRAP transporter small permease subunit [Paracoccaceae bacterium]
MSVVAALSDAPARGNTIRALLDRVIRAVGAVYSVIAAFGVVWIFGLMVLIVADVAGRNLIAAPIIGVAEIAARSVVAIVFLLLPAAVIRGTLIQADFLLRLLRRRSGRLTHALEALFSLVGALILGAVAVASWPDTLVALTSNEFFGVQGIWTLPTFPFRLIVVGGAALSAFGFVLVALREITRVFGKG